MIYRRSSLLPIVLMLVFSAVAPSQDASISETVDKYLSIRTEMGGFSGAVLIVVDGKILIRKGYGYADVENKVPFTPETKSEVASVSKMFTSMAALKLRDVGRLKLEDPICNYLQDCPEAWRPVTIKQLMTHTSGIPDYESKLDLGSDKYLAVMTNPGASRTLIDDARKLPLDFKPGEKFNYSNTGYILLSYVVQKASAVSFEDWVNKVLLRPAGMTNSGVIDAGHLPKSLAKGYTHGDLGWEKTLAGVPLSDGHLKLLPQLTLESPEGDAWLYSTVDDLYKWSKVMDGGGLVSPEEANEVFTANLDGYGYGWFVGQGFDRPRYRHNGQLPGYVTDFIKFPKDKITIIIMSNLDRARLSSISRDISSAVLGKPFDMPVRGKVVKLTPTQLASLEGTFQMADGKILSIKNEPDYLTAKLQDRFTAGLIPMSGTEFYFPLGDGKATFTLDEKGKAVQVNLRYSGEDHIAKITSH